MQEISQYQYLILWSSRGVRQVWEDCQQPIRQVPPSQLAEKLGGSHVTPLVQNCARADLTEMQVGGKATCVQQVAS